MLDVEQGSRLGWVWSGQVCFTLSEAAHWVAEAQCVGEGLGEVDHCPLMTKQTQHREEAQPILGLVLSASFTKDKILHVRNS